MSEDLDKDKTTELENASSPSPEKKPKHHLIKVTWLRRTLKVLGCLLLFIIILPFLLYIPPIQTFVKNEACKIIYNSTGMKVQIDKFRLKFPLDVSLQGLSVVEASGDTMVSAKEALVDVKLLPLLKLDVKVKKLKLDDAYYRLVSSDTSMIMTLRAGYLEVDDKSSMDIKKSRLALNKAILRDADIQMYQDVWRKKPTPQDTTAGMIITIGDLEGERIRFGMSMLPTIDTLALYTGNINLRDGVINLDKSIISANLLSASGGDLVYLTPPEDFIKSHPAPVDTTSAPSPPMVIEANVVKFNDFDVTYGVAGAKPQPGFDASLIQVSRLNLEVDSFYNKASTLRLPIKSLSATERCGLEITQGSGLVALDSLGIDIDRLNILTPYSRINLTAGIPFELMELKPEAPVNIVGNVSLGIPDIVSFMPDVKSFTKYLPSSTKINVDIDAHGTLSDVEIPKFDLAIPSILTLNASGNARNPMDFKNMVANVNIDGRLTKPAALAHFIGDPGFELPPFTIKGKASVNHENYAANLSLHTPKGNVAAIGKVNLNSERYDADVKIDNFDVRHFMPTLGIGNVTAHLTANGNGFNPMEPKANTDIDLEIASIDYEDLSLRDISLQAKLHDSDFSLDLNSPNRDIDLSMMLDGSLHPDEYMIDGKIQCNHLDLQALGLDTTMNNGNFDIYIKGTASPDRWLYDLSLDVNNFDWNMPDRYIHLPQGIQATLLATENSVDLDVDCQQTCLKFSSEDGLQAVVDKFSNAASEVTRQLDNKHIVMDSIQSMLPPFHLALNSPGKGLIDQFLAPSEISLDTLYLNLNNDSILTGSGGALGINTASLQLDTVTLGLNQRGSLLDYKIHVGEKPGAFDEFANVNLNGYIGSNRVSAYLNQQNAKGETGYRIGLTAALMDSIVTVHFTPLKAMIGYRPWNFNADNYIDLNARNFKVDANLEASSNESAILLETRSGADDLQELHLKLTNIKVQDFLQMSVTAPPLTATVNSDIRARYDGKELVGIGRLGVTDFNYDNHKVDDLNLNLNASVDLEGDSEVAASLNVAGKKAMTLSTKLVHEDESLVPEFVKLTLDHFPLSVANPFIGAETARLSGAMTGEMDLTGKLTSPLLNGSLQFDSVAIYLPIMGSSLKFDDTPLTVTDNVIRVNNFSIFGANSNPLTIDGSVDARKFSEIIFDVSAHANNFQLINNDNRAGSDLYGKLFLNLNASAKGPMTHFTVDGNLNILGTTDVYYTLSDAGTALPAEKNNDVVKFVNLNDTISDNVKTQEAVYMRVIAALSITPGAMVTVNLSNNGTDRVQLSPSGSLNFYRNYMNDMTLNGQLNLGQGFARYNIPVIGQKEFEFDPGSYVLWNGALLNPTLNINATDKMKVNVLQDGSNSHLVTFLVKVGITNNLNSPKVLFDLVADDDMTIENELQSMSAEQRNSVAMNLLVTGQYTSTNVSTANGPITGNVYNFLASQLNSWAAKNIRGVDLSFGVDQYNKTVDGETSTATSYSYQVSKSLFNNRFKINVGGNYSTDDSPDDNLTQNLINDISFEYILRQTQTQTMYLQLFRHNSYESILEGEITEMGGGFVFKRRIGNIKDFFRIRRRKKAPAAAPTITQAEQTLQPDTVTRDAEKGGENL